ncbi:MAG TPA: PqiC family protein [Caldimonas sp.]
MRHPEILLCRAATVLVAAAVALAACSSAPPIRLHTLMPIEPPERAASLDGAPPFAIVLEPIRIPVQVDQAQWLVRLPDGSVAVLEQERWVSPLRDEIRQALLESLVVRYAAVEARAASRGAAPPWRVAVDILRFDSAPGREARIEGAWTISGAGADSRVTRCEWLVRESAADGMPALAAAHRRALERLGAGIGESLRRLARGEPAGACPAREASP